MLVLTADGGRVVVEFNVNTLCCRLKVLELAKDDTDDGVNAKAYHLVHCEKNIDIGRCIHLKE